MDSIAGRLAEIDGLYFPRSVVISSPSPSRLKTLLLDLLSRDPSIFLERYGAHLTADELRSFETLSGDYSVRFHLSRLRAIHDPSPADRRSRTAAIRNRRRAYLERLVKGGDYFSEEAMREREPYLHHEMLGRFQDPMGRVMSRPGERWSDTLLRRCEEAAIVEKIRGEQKRLGVDPREWVGGGDGVVEEEEQMEEVESEEEESESEEERDQSRSMEVCISDLSCSM